MFGISVGIMDGAGGAAAGDYESIATTTVGSGGAATVTFSSIPSTYKHLQLRSIGRTTDVTSDNNTTMRFNSDTGANYWWHLLYGDGSSALATNPTTAQTSMAPQPTRVTGTLSGASIFGVGVCDILDYANTNKNTTVRVLTGHDQNGSGIIFLASGLWSNTAAVTSIQISGNLAQYSQIALYGIKG